MAGTQGGDSVDMDMHTDDDKPGILDAVVRALTDMMSNKHRGYGALRPGGGIHPVQGIGVETGGSVPTFDTQYSQKEILAALRDGILGDMDHVLGVRAQGPFNGYILPGHTFQASQNAFAVLTVGQTPMPVRIVNAHPLRLDIMLKAVEVGNGGIIVGSTENVTAESGYPLTQGEVITLPTRSEVFAVATSTTTQPILATLSTMRDG